VSVLSQAYEDAKAEIDYLQRWAYSQYLWVQRPGHRRVRIRTTTLLGLESMIMKAIDYLGVEGGRPTFRAFSSEVTMGSVFTVKHFEKFQIVGIEFPKLSVWDRLSDPII